MKKEFYEIYAKLPGINGYKVFKILADCHRQHIWNETTLIDVSKSGAKKINALKSQGSMINVMIADRLVRVTEVEARK